MLIKKQKMAIRRRNISVGSFSYHFLRDCALVNRKTKGINGVGFIYVTHDELAVTYIQMKMMFSFCCIV